MPQTTAPALGPFWDYLRRTRRAALLFSGGLDSSLILAAASAALGDGFRAITFYGPHTTPGELAAAWRLARRFRVRHLVGRFDPLALPEFRHNRRERCYACKAEVIRRAWELAAHVGAPVLWDGTNLDDLADFRPGLQAGRELGVQSPLLAVGWGKAAIRRASQALGLAADKPAQSCLATRFPYDVTLTPEILAAVGRAEAWLRRRGFERVRLRVPGPRLRLELDAAQWPAYLHPKVHGPFGAVVQRLGWQGVDLAAPPG
jgi:uncharacterized protein